MTGYIIYNENGELEDILPLTNDEYIKFLEKNPNYHLEETELNYEDFDDESFNNDDEDDDEENECYLDTDLGDDYLDD